MKAFAIQQEKTIQAIEMAEPQMSATDVLIEIHYIGLCGLMPFVTLPRVPGHEISGVILKKGSAVPDTLTVGDRVTVSPYTRCGVCPSCRSGRDNCCQYNQTLGVQRDGALTERIAVPFEKVFTSTKLSPTGLALVEPFSVGYHGANRGEVRETDTVLVIGCGTIGMGALSAAVRKGANVIALDIDDSKLEKARRFGAAHTINSSSENVRKRIDAITNNEGVSVVIEAAGSPATFNMALDLVCFSGRIVTIGYSKNETGIKTQLIVSKELNIYGSRNALRVFPAVIGMIEQNEALFLEMITKIFPFDETPEAFAYWDANPGTVSKILIKVK